MSAEKYMKSSNANTNITPAVKLQVDKKPAKVSEEFNQKAEEKISTTKIRVTLRKGFYLKRPTIIFTALAFFAYNYILFFFLTWFPSYLQKGLGIVWKK